MQSAHPQEQPDLESSTPPCNSSTASNPNPTPSPNSSSGELVLAVVRALKQVSNRVVEFFRGLEEQILLRLEAQRRPLDHLQVRGVMEPMGIQGTEVTVGMVGLPQMNCWPPLGVEALCLSPPSEVSLAWDPYLRVDLAQLEEQSEELATLWTQPTPSTD